MSKIVKQLKQIQADAHALYIKTHNYHWNVKGMDFFPVHSYTQKIYEEMSELYDDMAEKVLILGEKPYLTIEELAKETKIETETKDSFKSREILESIIKDYKYLLEAFKTLSNTAEKDGDKSTQAFADDKVSKFEKDLWMLGNMVK